ncbi:MAG: Hsp20 family protein [Eubacteriales bacterium]|nr:Hsp20 family protein [Eubacteriales bacterium]
MLFENADMEKAEKTLCGDRPKRLIEADVFEAPDHYRIELSLPGFRRDRIGVTLENGCLCVEASGETSEETGEKKTEKETGKYLRKEREEGSCGRSFYLGTEIREDQIRADLENGILTLFLPKRQGQPQEKRQIPIG